MAEEVRNTFGRKMVQEKPDIVVLGEAEWWSRWLHGGTDAKTVLEQKAGEISQDIGTGYWHRHLFCFSDQRTA
jgi:hypothetical protein